MINQLWSNILWGQRSNFVASRRIARSAMSGWDGWPMRRSSGGRRRTTWIWRRFRASSARYARDAGGHALLRHLFSGNGEGEHGIRGAGWSDAGVIIPWTSWLQNRRYAASSTRTGRRWRNILTAIDAANPDGLWKNDVGNSVWRLAFAGRQDGLALIATAYWAYDVTLMRQMAHATGRTADEEKYAAAVSRRFARRLRRSLCTTTALWPARR